MWDRLLDTSGRLVLLIVRGMRRWLLPVIAALVIGVIILGSTHQWRRQSDNQVPTAALSRGLEQREIDLLKDGDFDVVPLDRTPTQDEANKAVASAVGSFGFTSRDQIESVAFAEVTGKYRKLDTKPMLLVYLAGVPMHPTYPDASESDAAGASDDGGSDMVVMVDPDTMKFAWATQG